MPYMSNDELPLAVRKAYRADCQTQFRKAFNAAMSEYGDEGRAMATAHAQAKRCMGAGMTMGKAEWDTAYINNLPDSAFAVILPGGEKDESGRTVPRSLRKLPHHNAGGEVDMAHLRNAMSREPQTDMPEAMHTKAMAHLHAHMSGMGKALLPVKATVIDDDAFRLLAIPFGGPIPSKASARGVDLDGEWFSERTDIKPDWFDVRLVDWHHGRDKVLGRTVLGKAGDLAPDEDGWWVTVWLDHGEKRLELIRRLAERGAQLFGSSETVGSMVRKADTGEILAWPYLRQTLSTSPQNTYSVIRPLKATLDELIAEGMAPSAAFWSDPEVVRNLGDDLRSTLGAGEIAASRGRVPSAKGLGPLIDRVAELAARRTTTGEAPDE